MKTLIVYHQVKPGLDCPDGICAAWVVSKAVNNYELIGEIYLNNKEYESPSYQLPFDPTNKRIILVDFSYPYALLDEIANKASELIILDHHESRLNDISQLLNQVNRVRGGYSANDCGATFAWLYFFPGEAEPWFLRHVRRRDIGSDGYYEGECRDSEAINTAISARRSGLVGIDSFTVFDQLLNETEQTLIDEGIQFILERDELVEEALSHYNGAVIQVGDYIVPYYQLANPKAHKHYSVIGSAAAKLHTDHEFIVIVTGDPLQISMRAAKHSTVHLGYLALSLGGGGQARAAGFKLVKNNA